MTMRTPASSLSTRGTIGGTSGIASAAASASATVAERDSDRTLATVGGSIA